ncbi:MAG: hypothetical protein ACRC0G_02965 [Fusobacteriaceae bacterium]
MTKILNNMGCTSDLGSQLTNSEIGTLAQILSASSKNKMVAKRAGTTIEPSAVRTQFKATSEGNQLNPVELFGDYKEMYLQAENSVFTPAVRTSAENVLDSAISTLNVNSSDVIAKAKLTEDANKLEIVKTVRASVETDRVREQFKLMLSLYDCEFVSLDKVLKSNKDRTKTEVSFAFNFSFNNMSFFTIELPVINKNGRFTRNGNEYLYTLLAKNLKKYALGTDEFLELVQAYTYLIEQMLTVYVDKGVKNYYDASIFANMCKNVRRDGTIKALQNNLDKVLNNAERDYINNKEDLSPVMWVDKYASNYSKHLNSQMIGLDMEYDLMIEVSNLNNGLLTVKGLDLLTGSTSEPAKRCKIAIGYEISYINHRMFVTKKSENLHELSEIFSEYKFSNVGTLRTSSKRDNSCTVSSTSNFVNPQKYVKRVSISFAK